MSSYTSSPEAFGARLRTLREQAVPRLSGTALAARLGWAQSKVSRIENGKQLPTTEDVTAWCQAVGAPGDVGELLAELRNVQSEFASLRRQLRDGMRAKQADFLELEQSSATIRVFEPVIIPGLLQTAEYARHRLMESVTRFGADVADLPGTVRERLRRQEILYEGGTRHIQFLVTEATLRYRLAPAPVMRGQLDRLLALAGLDTIELRVIPFGATYATAPLHGFWIFDDRLVQAETFMAELVLRERQQIQAYTAVFEDLWALGLDGEDATGLVSAVARELRI